MMSHEAAINARALTCLMRKVEYGASVSTVGQICEASGRPPNE
jgi:hypothetical protein